MDDGYMPSYAEQFRRYAEVIIEKIVSLIDNKWLEKIRKP